MDYEAGEALRSILGRRDADKVPTELAKKIEKYIAEKCDEHIEVQALYETLQRSSGKLNTVFVVVLLISIDVCWNKISNGDIMCNIDLFGWNLTFHMFNSVFFIPSEYAKKSLQFVGYIS